MDIVASVGEVLQGLISPLSLGDIQKDKWTEDAESAFPGLKLPGVESPKRKSLRCARAN